MKFLAKQLTKRLGLAADGARRPAGKSSFRPVVEFLEDRTLLNVQFTVDPLQDAKPISPYIYGVNQNLPGYTNYPYLRSGGDSWTTYNWENNFDNGGHDWYFENYDELGGETTLNQAIDNQATTTTIPVADAAALIPSNAAIAANPGLYFIWIDNEQMQVTAVDTTANTLTVVRATGGTTIASHLAGANVLLPGDAVIPTIEQAAGNNAAVSLTVPIQGNVSADDNDNDDTPTVVATTIAADVTSTTATTIQVANAAAIPSVPYYIVVGNNFDSGDAEEMEVTAVNFTTNTLTVVRDIMGPATTPTAGTPVYLGFDVRNSGPNYLQTRFTQELPTKPGAPDSFSLSPDPNSGQPVYADEYVNWVKANFPYGETSSTTPIWYQLDNEPDLWSSTQAEVQPTPTTYAELIQDNIEYAEAIKSVEPNAFVMGSVNWGWSGYVNLAGAPDADGRDWVAYYLQQMAQASATYGEPIVNDFDVHFYNATASDPSDVMQAPQSLWNPNYQENSWVGSAVPGPIDLLPRLEAEINQYDPGTKLSISEYNYGLGDQIYGAIAEADALGIFGQQGVYAAAEWQLLASEPYIGAAFNMYRDFDGNDGTFGDTSIYANTSDVTDTSIYGSIDSSNSNDMTLVAINKDSGSLTASIDLQHVQPGATAAIYQLTGASTSPQYMGMVTITDPADFSYTMPGYSITTIRIVSSNAAGSAPTIAMPAQAASANVTGVSVALSVLGADAGGAANLTYTWATTAGPAPVSFSANGSNAAQNTVATFSAAGDYTFLATITDADGFFATSSVSVTVDQTVTDITVTPFDPTLPIGSSEQFAATSVDQFGNAMTPAFAWSADAGSVTSAGVYTAPATAGNMTITASVGNVQGSTSVFVVQPSIITVSAATDAALRTAVASANTDAAGGQAATIDFDASLAGDTITLSQDPLELTAGTALVTIDGGGLITLSGGGAMQLFKIDSGAQASLIGLTLTDATTTADGGAIDNAGQLIVNDCSLLGDTAGAGGGIDNSGTLTVSNSSFTGDTAAANGGAIDNEATGTLTMLATTLSNSTAQDGGGLFNAGTAVVTNCTFSDNSAVNAGTGAGGGIDNTGTITLAGSIVTGNSSDSSGGGISSSGPMTVTGCTIANNTASYIAGGINNLGPMTVTDSTLTGNYSYLGGGIYNGNNYSNSGNLTLTDDTITSNFADYGAGGGIYMASGGDGPSTLALFNCVVAGNFASGNGSDFLSNNTFPYGPDINVYSGTVTGSNNLIGDGQGITGLTNGLAGNQIGTPAAPIDPMLAPLASNADLLQSVTAPVIAFNRGSIPLDDHGGPTATVAIEGGSPAIGAGGAITTVTGPLISGSDTIPVADAAAIASTPGQYFILIDGEEMEVTGVNLNNNELTVERGINGVNANLHSGDAVYLATDQRGFARALPGDIGAYQSQAAPASATVPTVTSVSPIVGSLVGGATVTITGENLAGVTEVNFGNLPAAIETVSANQLLVISPTATDAGTIDVTVSTAISTSASGPADQFTYETTPTITSIGPTSGLPGGGLGVTITGTNLLGASAVEFGGNPATIYSDTFNQLIVVEPAGNVGTIAVQVTTPAGVSAQTPADQFTYTATSTSIVVTTASDALTAPGLSLREAIAQADLDAAQGISDTITFAASLSGDTIALDQGTNDALVLSGGGGTITIAGGNDITVSGASTSQIFAIQAGAQVVLAGLTITDGQAGSGNGGAIDNAGAFTLLDDTLSNNTGTLGGAVYNTGALTILNSTFSNNFATNGGGLDTVNGATATVSGSTFTGNTSTYIGGGIANQGHLTVANSTLYDNSSYLGGGINNGNQYGNGGTLALVDDTLDDNSVTGNGGGVYMENGGYAPTASSLILMNSIVAGNSADQSGPDLDVASGALSGADNLIGIGAGFTSLVNKSNGNQVGASASPLNPDLAGLAGNGGPTQTMALQTGSPAIGKAGAVTTLAAAIGGATVTAIPVANAAAIACTAGQYFIQIGSEVMEVTAVNLAYDYLMVIRGINGVVATHPANAPIYLATDQRGRARPTAGDVGAFQSKTTAPTAATIYAVSPAAGPTDGGSVVSISGVNLAGATAVHFGTLAGTILSVSSDLILAASPAGTGNAKITVTTPTGTSAASAATAFAYLGAPTVTAMSPATGLTAGGTGVLITGTNLLDATAVDFAGNPGTIVLNSADEIIALSPASTGHPAAGVVQVTVITPAGTSKTSAADKFTYTASTSTLTVTTASDALIHTGTSLRDAMTQADADAARGVSDTIVFAGALNGATLTLGPRADDTLQLSGTATITINGGGHITISGGNAAGIFEIDSGATAILTGLTITNGNAGGNNGGAIENDGTLTLIDDTFAKNSAANGGAVDNTGALTVLDSTFTDNTAGEGGALNNINGATATISACTFTGNTGSYIGGAIDNQANMIVTNSTLYKNNSYLGGAINNGNQYGNGGTLTLVNDTITANTVTGDGGGVYMEDGGYAPTASSLTMLNTLIAGNTADQGGPDVNVSAGALSGSNNFIGSGDGQTSLANGADGNLVGTSAVPLNPNLGTFASNGGPTQSLALGSGSQAIAAGGAVTTLAAAVNSTTATTITVSNAALLGLTSPPAGYGFAIVVDAEMMLVTAINGNILTVVRGYHGTKAAVHGVNANVFLGSDQRGLIAPTNIPDIGAYQTPTHLRVVTNPAADTVSPGQKLSFTAAAIGVNPSVQWQISTNHGKSWSSIGGATAKTVSIVNGVAVTTSTYSANATAAMNGDMYRAVFTTSADKTDSLPASLTVS